MGLKISQKTTLIVVSLLMFEVSFLCFLLVLLHQSEIEAQSYERSSQLIAEANGLLNLTISACDTLDYYVSMDEPSIGERYTKVVDEIRGQLENIRKEIAIEDPSSLTEFKELAIAVDAGFKQLDGYKH